MTELATLQIEADAASEALRCAIRANDGIEEARTNCRYIAGLKAAAIRRAAAAACAAADKAAHR